MNRENQIKEILNEDQKFYRQRFELERKAARLINESYAPPNRFERAVAFNIDKNFIDLRAAIDNVLATQAEGDASKVIQLYEQTVKYIDAYAEKRGLVQRDVSVIEDKFDALKPSIQNLVYISTSSGWRITDKLVNIEENIENRTYSYQDIDLPEKLLTRPGASAPIALPNVPINEPEFLYVPSDSTSPVKRNRRNEADMWLLLQSKVPNDPITRQEFLNIGSVKSWQAYIVARQLGVDLTGINLSDLGSDRALRDSAGINNTDYINAIKVLNTNPPVSRSSSVPLNFPAVPRQAPGQSPGPGRTASPFGNGMPKPNFAKQMSHTEGLVLPKKKGRGKKMMGGISNAEDEDFGRPFGVDKAIKLRAIDKKPMQGVHFAPDQHLTLEKRMMFLNQLDSHAVKDDDAEDFNSTRNLYKSMEKRLKKLK